MKHLKLYEEFNLRNIFKKNKIYPDIDFSDNIDPYGEEDWNEITDTKLNIAITQFGSYLRNTPYTIKNVFNPSDGNKVYILEDGNKKILIKDYDDEHYCTITFYDENNFILHKTKANSVRKSFEFIAKDWDNFENKTDFTGPR